MSTKPQFVDNIGRRTWDVEKYRDQVQQRQLEQEQKAAPVRKQPVARGALQARSYKLDLTSNVGKTVVVSANAALSQRAGFYCDVCDVLLHDSVAYLAHINGRKHQKKLNMSMQIERVSLERVKARIALLKEQRGITSSSHTRTRETVEERMRRHQLEDEEAERLKRAKKKQKRMGGDNESLNVPFVSSSTQSTSETGMDGYVSDDLVFDDSDTEPAAASAAVINDQDQQATSVNVIGGRTIVIREANPDEEDDDADDQDETNRYEEDYDDEDDEDGDFVPVTFSKEQLDQELARAQARAADL